MKSVGQVIFAFFEDYPKTHKGLRPGSVRSYRDTLKLFLAYVASNCRRPIRRLTMSDLSAQRVLDFLHMIEVTRRNHVSTRNQRLAADSASAAMGTLRYSWLLTAFCVLGMIFSPLICLWLGVGGLSAHVGHESQTVQVLACYAAAASAAGSGAMSPRITAAVC